LQFAVRSSQSAAGGSQFGARRACALVAAATALLGSAAAVHYYGLGLTLAHYDARAHLVVARRVFDSLTPGWQQVGAVWLPLPHIANALPVQIDWFYRSGASGVAISIASMALAAWAIARLTHLAAGSIIGGGVAAALLMLNPNVLYLQSTPMTEPLLFGTTFLAVALVAEWCVTLPLPASRFPLPASGYPLPAPHSGPPSPDGHPAGFGETGARRLSRAPGWACIAAVLTRYEAFPIIAAAIGLAFVVLLRRGWHVVPALRAVRGLALWPLWALAAFAVNSKVSVGAWFVSGGFFVAENPALGHPWIAWAQIWEGLGLLAGPVIPWLALASAVAVVAAVFGRKDSDRAALIVVLALVAAAALPLYAYYQGHPVRIRYGVPLVAASAALIGSAVALLPRRLQAVAGILVVALSVWHVRPFDRQAPVVVESQRDVQNAEGRRAVTAHLAANWDGRPIMMSMGSLGHYMHDLSLAGFGIDDFLHEGNGEIWKYAVRHPHAVAEWIAIEERSEGGDALAWQAAHDPRFLKGYARVAEGGGVALYRRF
jgi:hypothetical protein